ncbi:MAG: HDOD domain-containing protein [Desulfuromonadales bacterium]|nr:HDOD domain-containing protein [Desulfuromonadales bacterium]
MSHLFSAPHVAAQLLGACQGNVFSPQALGKIVLQDSAFCARILTAGTKSCPERIVPSAPLSSALSGLSLAVVKSQAIQSARLLVDTGFTAEQAQFMRELWFYSQLSSIVAGCLAEAISYPHPEEAQLAGLLSHIGILSLFCRAPQQYLDDIGTPLGGKETRGKEQVSFGTDHLQVADAMISGWQLESFMADSVNLQHHAIEECREASTLVRIVRLAREFCQSPFELNDALLSAAETLFSFNRSDTEYLFNRAGKHYRPLSPFSGDRQACLEEFGRVQKRLTSVVFSIADQEGVHAQLAESDGLETFIARARSLYLQSSPARDVLFFVVDQQQSRLRGVPSAQQSRLVAELNPSLAAGGLLAEALRTDRLRHSFAPENPALSVFDRQLVRLCKGQGVVCLPLQVDGQLLGGVALGIGGHGEVEAFTTPQLQLLNATVARALATMMAAQSSAVVAESVRSGRDLIPKLVHEVSNPLTIINNYLGVVGTMLQGTDNEEVLAAMENEIKRIGEILKYYSDLKDTPQLPDAAVDLNELILAVVESLRATFFHPKQIEISTDFDSSIRPLKTKPVVIKQILVNLLKNAAEALSQGGKIILTTRELTTSAGQHFVDIRVQDNGPGIPREIQQRLFSPVTSTKGGDHAGLGLNIVKGMVDDIGAKISCYSSAEFGTSFDLEIPRPEE